MDEADRVPRAGDAERALLGGLIADPEQIPAFAERLRAEDFHDLPHQRLYTLLLELVDRGEPVDPVGITERVAASGRAGDYGGVAYVAALPDRVPSTENLAYYADLVREAATRRRLIGIGHRLVERAGDGSLDIQAVIDEAEADVFGVGREQSRGDWERLGAILQEEWEALDRLQACEGEVTGVPSGFIDLDRLLAGFQPSDLVILAARPSMGKTALALNIAQNACLRGGVGVGIFSLEMSSGQLVRRMLCAEGRVDASRLRTGRLDAADLERLEGAAERLGNAPLWIVDEPALSLMAVRSKARRLKGMHPELGLLLVDYLQLMQGSPRDPREQQIAQISRGLKALAKELDLPVIALSQLNRGVEARTDKRPMLSDLRESGAIEQDADVILFIYRDEYYNENSPDRGVAEVLVAKQRNGPTGVVRLAYQGRFVRFDNLAREEDIPGGYA